MTPTFFFSKSVTIGHCLLLGLLDSCLFSPITIINWPFLLLLKMHSNISEREWMEKNDCNALNIEWIVAHKIWCGNSEFTQHYKWIIIMYLFTGTRSFFRFFCFVSYCFHVVFIVFRSFYVFSISHVGNWGARMLDIDCSEPYGICPYVYRIWPIGIDEGEAEVTQLHYTWTLFFRLSFVYEWSS